MVGPGRSGGALRTRRKRKGVRFTTQRRKAKRRERDRASWWVLAGLVGNAPPDEKEREYGSPHKDARLREVRRRDRERHIFSRLAE